MSYKGIGIYSDSSCEYLDLSCVVFKGSDDSDIWSHEVIASERVPYDEEQRERMLSAYNMSGLELIQLHIDFGHMIGTEVNEFIEKHNLTGVQFVSSHGHTIFHKPGDSMTFQIGDGETIASHLTCLVITNFRTKDIALHGQGGSIMRVGEAHLFGEYNVFIDLAGFCFLSTENVSFAICPCNLLLHYLCDFKDCDIGQDNVGDLAKTGSVNKEFLDALNQVEYFSNDPPKLIDVDWFYTDIVPIINKFEHISDKDLLRTAIEHITQQISIAIKNFTESNDNDLVRVEKTALINGVGTDNAYLMEQMREKLDQYSLNLTIVDVDNNTRIYKECIITAFIGLRSLLNLQNIDDAVTGADIPHISGSIHLPPSGIPTALFDTDQYAFSIQRRRTSSAKQLQLPAASMKSMENPLSLKTALQHRSSWPIERPPELIERIRRAENDMKENPSISFGETEHF